jgi:hypothetical protein
MSRHTKTLIPLVGALYLFLGLSIFPAPVMFLIFAPRSMVFSIPMLINIGVLVLIFGPCWLIGYALIRRRKWGIYLLVAYNGIGFVYFAVLFFQRLNENDNDNENPLPVWAMIAFIAIVCILGSLIAFALRSDVKALMSHRDEWER